MIRSHYAVAHETRSRIRAFPACILETRIMERSFLLGFT